MNEHNFKSSYINQEKSFEKNSLSLTQSPINKSLINSSCVSRLSTNLNSSESFLLKSLYINNNLINFRMKNINLKNNIFSTTLNEINKNYHQKFIRNKLSKNFSKLQLPKMNTVRGSFSPPSKAKESLNIINNYKDNNSVQIHSYFTPKNKVLNINESFIELKLRDELYDILNSQPNRYKKYFFKESILNRALIQKFIHEQQKIYVDKVKNDKIYKYKVKEKEKKVKKFYGLVSHDEFNILNSYNLFLQKKVHEMKEIDFDYYRRVLLLKKEIKNLFIRIKILSDRLWYLFDIRNFLICVKERIPITQLPLIFCIYNSEYLDELTKINEKDIYLLEKMGKPKKNLNLFRIPTNLINYINAINELHKETIDKRFVKYLDKNYVIFSTPEEFIDQYIMTEKDMLDHLRTSLSRNNYNRSEKLKLQEQIDLLAKNCAIFEGNYKREKRFYDQKKNQNIYYNKIKNNLSCVEIVEKEQNEELDEKEIETRKFLEEERLFKNNENFLKMLQKKTNVEQNKFLLKYNELKNNKKFKTEKEYVYFFIYKNIITLLNIYPEYFYRQKKFSLKTMNKYIHNIKNCHKFPEIIIRMNVIYLLSIYEDAISNFLLDYQKNVEKYRSTAFYDKIMKNLAIYKKSLFLKEQKILENKVKQMKFERFSKKYSRYRYRQRNVVINDSFKFKKVNSFDDKIIKRNEGVSEEKSLLNS